MHAAAKVGATIGEQIYQGLCIAARRGHSGGQWDRLSCDQSRTARGARLNSYAATSAFAL